MVEEGERRQYEKEQQQGAEIHSKPVTPPPVCQFHSALRLLFRLQVAAPSIRLLITQEETEGEEETEEKEAEEEQKDTEEEVEKTKEEEVEEEVEVEEEQTEEEVDEKEVDDEAED